MIFEVYLVFWRQWTRDIDLCVTIPQGTSSSYTSYIYFMFLDLAHQPQ